MKGLMILTAWVALAGSVFASAEVGSKAYFDKPPFVSPKLVEDFMCWVSDNGDQVIEINLDDAQGSNRYFCEPVTFTAQNAAPRVQYEHKEGNETLGFRYQWIGRSSGGLDVLRTTAWSGGTMIDERVLILRRRSQAAASIDVEKGIVSMGRVRTILIKVAEIGLGDRYAGSVRLDGDVLFVGKDEQDGHEKYVIDGHRAGVDHRIDLAPLVVKP